MLGFEGHCILTAIDASQAQAVLQRSAPDLILMDVGLPDMDGLVLTRKLKTDKETCHISSSRTASAMTTRRGTRGRPRWLHH